MEIPERYLIPEMIEDLKEKMVFLGGASQEGKTAFSTDLIKHL
jgi:2-phosphoglycerate kinase